MEENKEITDWLDKYGDPKIEKQVEIEAAAMQFYPLENQLMERVAFKRGYTEGSEKMYSEEEVLKVLHDYRNHFELYRNIQVLPDMFFPWFEKIKKEIV
jgi:hypothetical protein